MPAPHLIQRPIATTPSGGSSGRERALPPDLLREASVRLGIWSLVGAALWLLGPALGHLAIRESSPPGDTRWRSLMLPMDAIAVVSVVLSLALFAYTRRSSDAKRTLDMGLVYMIATAFGLGIMFHAGAIFADARLPAPGSLAPEVSWIGAVILMCAAIVPTPPRRMFVAALIAVLMNPLGMLIARAQGTMDFASPADAFLMHYPDFLLVGVAVVISHVVTQLGRKVTKAREMGSYRLGDLLGSGGMGEVYRATHTMLARPAAVKLIRAEALGASDSAAAQLAVKRFSREAEAAANLRSPHTVEVYDFGVTEDRTLYFVMEMLDGMDLESLVRQHGPLPAGRVIHIARQVCESLAEAHGRGLVHRDIKPANIHVGRVGIRHDFVKVLDFGLVKSVQAQADHDSLLTAAGLALGTPAYMAPEAALGEEVDGRADLYALGCVMYFLLTSRPVFEGDNAMRVMVRHVEEKPVPPSSRTENAIPSALDDVVLGCLAKDPANRPPDAMALDEALANVASAAEPWDEERAARWWAERAGASLGTGETVAV